MKYYKKTENGYITLIGTNCGGKEITEKEYNKLIQIIKNKPKVTDDEHDYKLKITCEWELSSI